MAVERTLYEILSDPSAYPPRSKHTGAILRQIFQMYQEEGLVLPSDNWTDFDRDYIKEHLPELSPEEQQEVLEALPPETRLAGLSEEQIRQYLEQRSAGRPARSRNPRRKK